MQISGTGHWFLEAWIGDHSIELLVDSGSSVTAMSDLFYQTLVHAGAPLGTLQYTARTLRSAHGTGIEVLILHGVIFGLTNRVSHHYLQPCDRN